MFMNCSVLKILFLKFANRSVFGDVCEVQNEMFECVQSLRCSKLGLFDV